MTVGKNNREYAAKVTRQLEVLTKIIETFGKGEFGARAALDSLGARKLDPDNTSPKAIEAAKHARSVYAGAIHALLDNGLIEKVGFVDDQRHRRNRYRVTAAGRETASAGRARYGIIVKLHLDNEADERPRIGWSCRSAKTSNYGLVASCPAFRGPEIGRRDSLGAVLARITANVERRSWGKGRVMRLEIGPPPEWREVTLDAATLRRSAYNVLREGLE